MITFCLDTNSILDFCYRSYPRSMFPSVWDYVDASVLASQIKFVLSTHIHDEIITQINFRNYDPKVFDKFKSLFKVVVIPIAEYEQHLALIKSKLISITHFKANTIEKNENDLTNLCVAQIYNATVITSEQGSNRSITDNKYRALKIPDTCHYYGIPCDNWLAVFKHILLSV